MRSVGGCLGAPWCLLAGGMLQCHPPHDLERLLAAANSFDFFSNCQSCGVLPPVQIELML